MIHARCVPFKSYIKKYSLTQQIQTSVPCTVHVDIHSALAEQDRRVLQHIRPACHFMHILFVLIFKTISLLEIRKRKANWIGHILRRNCLLKQVIEGKIKGEMEVTRRRGRGRGRKKLLDDLKDRRGYYHLKEEALDRTMWRNRFGRGVGPVVRQITE